MTHSVHSVMVVPSAHWGVGAESGTIGTVLIPLLISAVLSTVYLAQTSVMRPH